MARAAVLYGVFPLLHLSRLSQRIGHRFNLVILWGGLRGAVTLALALAVTENAAIDREVQRFVAVQATGFVLFTLLVPGLTLRPLIRWLGLDQLSPLDRIMRAHVLGLSRQRVIQTIRETGQRYRFARDLTVRVAESFEAPRETDHPAVRSVAPEEASLRLGLVALTQRERERVLDHFAARTVSGRLVDALLNDAGHLLDRTRTRGAEEYITTSRELVAFSRSFRFAHWLHRRFHLDGPLVDRVADRFEQLLVGRLVLDELAPYIDDVIAPIVGSAVAVRVHALRNQRQEMTDAALEALAGQYPGYAALLEERFLRRVALRCQDVEYRTLFDEQIVGPELYGVLQRDVQAARAATLTRPQLDLGLETRALIGRVPMFADLGRRELDAVARLLRPQLAVPDERLISTGDPGDSMYFISSGTVEVIAGEHRIQLTRGEFFGEMALLLDQPRQGDVTARTYCQLLVLRRRDFQSLLRSSRTIRESINRAAEDRTRMNRATAR
jgi:CPA1 family monovalent cation:H+ antiporter